MQWPCIPAEGATATQSRAPLVPAVPVDGGDTLIEALRAAGLAPVPFRRQDHLGEGRPMLWPLRNVMQALELPPARRGAGVDTGLEPWAW